MTKALEIKEEMVFNQELTDILETMKNIAIFQFRYLQKRRERFAKFEEQLGAFFRMIDMDMVVHEFVHPVSERAALVMITSDEGFMGDLNFQVIDAAMLDKSAKDAEFIIVGESGRRYVEDAGKSVISYKSAADSAGRMRLAGELTRYIVEGMADDKFGKVAVFYPKPISFMVQKVEVEELMPLGSVFARQKSALPGGSLIMESPVEGIVEYLGTEYLEQKLTELLEDSKLSEFAARAVRLEKSGQELMDKKKELRSRYFRAYHEYIDKNTRELFSSQTIIKRKTG